MNFYYWVGYHLSRLAGRLLFRFRVIHRERMIQSGPVILAMNHQSYLDPPLAGSTCDRPIYFLARRTLLDVPLLGRVLPKLNVIPVNQEGVDRSAIKAVIRVLQAGNGVLVFPEGSRTHRRQPSTGGTGIGFDNRQNARAGRADADLRRSRSAAARRRPASACANYDRDWGTDLVQRSRS